MRKIRVVLAGMSRLMRDTLRAVIEHESDFEVVGELRDAAGLAAAVQAGRPDVVFLGVVGSDRDLGGLTAAGHALTLVHVTAETADTVVLEQWPRGCRLRTSSAPAAVLAHLRRIVRHPDAS